MCDIKIDDLYFYSLAKESPSCITKGRAQNVLELLILIPALYWMALWLGFMHPRAAYSNLSSLEPITSGEEFITSHKTCVNCPQGLKCQKEFNLSVSQLFLSLWWPNVCCNHCSSILSVDKGEQFWPPVNRNHSLLKCPMHCQCTANTLPLPKVLECSVANFSAVSPP